MSDTLETDAEAKKRAKWLHKHKAPKEWLILTVSEVETIRAELLVMFHEHANALRERDEAITQRDEQVRLTLEVDRLRAQAVHARDEARRVLSEIANASHFDNIGNFARNKAKRALE